MSVVVGEQIQASTGAWSGVPTDFSYQWQESVDGVSLYGNIPGETRSDYIVSSGALGHWLRVSVVATNASGDSSAAFSDWVGPVLLSPIATRVPFVTSVTLLSGVKSTTSDAADDVRDVDKGWSTWV